jgi:hypothetical protein
MRILINSKVKNNQRLAFMRVEQIDENKSRII